DNSGYGCINRLQMATGGANFNNLFRDTRHETLPSVDFAAHAAAMGANARKVSSLAELEAGLRETQGQAEVTASVIDTRPVTATEAGGLWRDVAVPAVSDRPPVNAARAAYIQALKSQRAG